MPKFHVQFVGNEKTQVEADGFSIAEGWVEFFKGKEKVLAIREAHLVYMKQLPAVQDGEANTTVTNTTVTYAAGIDAKAVHGALLKLKRAQGGRDLGLA